MTLDLTQMKELEAKATRGNWHAGDCVRPTIILYAVDLTEGEAERHRRNGTSPKTLTLGHCYADGDGQGRRNMKFIAASRTFIPAAIAEIERLRERVAEMERALDISIKATNATLLPKGHE